jgi:hypothetical protein
MSEQYNAPQPTGYAQSTYFRNSPELMRGQQLAQTSMILGIISLFVVGIVLGPIAIVKAKRAEELHTAATAGKVTGWIGTIFGALGVVWFIFVVGTMIAVGAASY